METKTEVETIDNSRRSVLKKAYVAPMLVALGSSELSAHKKNHKSSSLHCKPGQQGNNGWGNGDQSAPGNSFGHNGAENNHKGKFQHNFGQPNP